MYTIIFYLLKSLLLNLLKGKLDIFIRKFIQNYKYMILYNRE